jgi:hypothetical protein
VGPGMGECVKRDIVVATGSLSSSCGATRDRSLRGHSIDEAPHVPHLGGVIMNIRGLLEREHEAVDQGGG